MLLKEDFEKVLTASPDIFEPKVSSRSAGELVTPLRMALIVGEVFFIFQERHFN